VKGRTKINNVTLKPIRATIVAVEKQQLLYIVSAKKVFFLILQDSVTNRDEMRPE